MLAARQPREGSGALDPFHRERTQPMPFPALLSAFSTSKVAEFLADLGPWAPVAFIALFVATTVLCIPGGILTLAGGFLFGPVWGFVYVWIASQLGASAAFGVSRHVARDWILRRLSRRPLLMAIEQAVSEEGWKIVVLSRLAPGSPFFLLNYLYGLTRIRFRDYYWATAFSMIPGCFLIVYLGSLGNLALSGRSRSPFEWALYGVGLLALGTAVYMIARRANRVLKEKLGQDPSRPSERQRSNE